MSTGVRSRSAPISSAPSALLCPLATSSTTTLHYLSLLEKKPGALDQAARCRCGGGTIRPDTLRRLLEARFDPWTNTSTCCVLLVLNRGGWMVAIGELGMIHQAPDLPQRAARPAPGAHPHLPEPRRRRHAERRYRQLLADLMADPHPAEPPSGEVRRPGGNTERASSRAWIMSSSGPTGGAGADRRSAARERVSAERVLPVAKHRPRRDRDAGAPRDAAITIERQMCLLGPSSAGVAFGQAADPTASFEGSRQGCSASPPQAVWINPPGTPARQDVFTGAVGAMSSCLSATGPFSPSVGDDRSSTSPGRSSRAGHDAGSIPAVPMGAGNHEPETPPTVIGALRLGARADEPPSALGYGPLSHQRSSVAGLVRAPPSI